MLQKPTNDMTIEDIHEIRRQISKKFNGDMNAITDDAERRAKSSGRPVWNPGSKPKGNTAG